MMAVSSNSLCISFACHVAQQLQYNARELSKEPGIRGFCSALAAELANVQQFLETASQEPAENSRLLKLLNNLERLCQVSVLLRVNSIITSSSGLLDPAARALIRSIVNTTPLLHDS